MVKEINEIAERLKGLREACGYSKEKLAQELGLDLKTYTDYEENGENVPISVIYEIANKFGVDFTEIITGVKAKLDTYHVVKKDAGRSIRRFPGYHFEDLAFRYAGKIMQPLMVTLEPSDDVPEPVTHPGQEFNYVIEGTVCVTFDDKELILEAGDSVYFNPTHPHGQHAVGDKTAKFLTVIVE
ncbi:MAG: helix-turn-helix transcriptional regulator [Clostridia bacterium]|nr:helix-turn-helix transcriptional regulator [Clostridia bacterium]